MNRRKRKLHWDFLPCKKTKMCNAREKIFEKTEGKNDDEKWTKVAESCIETFFNVRKQKMPQMLKNMWKNPITKLAVPKSWYPPILSFIRETMLQVIVRRHTLLNEGAACNSLLWQEFPERVYLWCAGSCHFTGYWVLYLLLPSNIGECCEFFNFLSPMEKKHIC